MAERWLPEFDTLLDHMKVALPVKHGPHTPQDILRSVAGVLDLLCVSIEAKLEKDELTWQEEQIADLEAKLDAATTMIEMLGTLLRQAAYRLKLRDKTLNDEILAEIEHD